MDLAKALYHLRMDGWTVLDGIVAGDQVPTLRAHCQDLVAEHRNPAAPPAIGHLPGYVNYDPAFAGYLADDRLLALVQKALGPNPRISFTTGTINYPGNGRGPWHADWPFNQNNAGHIAAPYPDGIFHLTTIWMLAPFTEENGGTLLVPGSHRAADNPTGDNGVDPMAPYSTETQATGAAGSVLVMDSRLWHATAANRSTDPRVAVVARYGPWWLDTRILMPGTKTRRRLVEEPQLKENRVPPLPAAAFAAMPEKAKPLFEHWIEAG